MFLNEDPFMEVSASQKTIFEQKLEDIIEKLYGFDELKKPMTYIKNGLGCCYTYMLYPGMEPTNNLGEQAMREHVILRKIIGLSVQRMEQRIISILHLCQLAGGYRARMVFKKCRNYSGKITGSGARGSAQIIGTQLPSILTFLLRFSRLIPRISRLFNSFWKYNT